MATPVWPSSLPQRPSAGGWTWTLQDNKVSFKPEVGDDIARRRGTAVVHKYDATFPDLTEAQRVTFEAFYQDDLKAGVLHFLWIDPDSGSNFKWKISTYRMEGLGAGFTRLSMKIRRLPGAAV